jgi:hypothetical protein
MPLTDERTLKAFAIACPPNATDSASESHSSLHFAMEREAIYTI